jgi:N-formylglutamate amidohydrolase
VVIGDRHGTTAASGLAARIARAARDYGYAAAINAPYAGAHGVARHGRPAAGIHALQLEIDRSLYLERDLRTPSSGVADAQTLVATLAWTAVSATRPDWSIAAE